MLKLLDRTGIMAILCLINLMLRNAILTPFFTKVKPQDDLNSYRPISITSSVSWPKGWSIVTFTGDWRHLESSASSKRDLEQDATQTQTPNSPNIENGDGVLYFTFTFTKLIDHIHR